MKKLSIFIGVAIITVVCVDLLFGAFMKYYVTNYQIPGDYKTIDYIMKNPKEDLYVLGSSVALNSVDPSMLCDSLGISCWNGASNAQTLTYCEVMTERICKEGKAKYILLGMKPDDLKGDDGRINLLMPYYENGINTLDNYLNNQFEFNHIFLKSNLFRYNTIWFRIFLYNFIEPGEKGERGFVAKPIPAVMPTLHYLSQEQHVDSEKGQCQFNNIVTICRNAGVELLVYFPPIYDKYEYGYVAGCKAISELCVDNNVPYWDMSQNEEYLEHPEWFYDNIHLNSDGAHKFTQDLYGWLKCVIK